MNNSSPFSNNSNGGAIWCRVAGGKIVRTATETTPGAIRVEVMRDGAPTGEYRYELHDQAVSGRIVKLHNTEKVFHGETVRNLVATLDFQGVRVCVQFKEGDRYWRALCTRLPNVNLLEDVKIAPYDFEPEGERRIGLVVWQGDKKVQPAFTRDNPGQLPPMQRVMYKGKERSDFTAQDQWINQHILLPIGTKLAAMPGAAAVPAEAPARPEPVAARPQVAAPPVGDEDDLPF